MHTPARAHATAHAAHIHTAGGDSGSAQAALTCDAAAEAAARAQECLLLLGGNATAVGTAAAAPAAVATGSVRRRPERFEFQVGWLHARRQLLEALGAAHVCCQVSGLLLASMMKLNLK
jgi:hypothetical protein